MIPLNAHFEKQNSLGIMAAKIWIRGGSRSDLNNQKGSHQLLGSLLSRGCGPYDYITIGDLVEGCGASLHCETYEDGILISLKCIKDDSLRLLPILGWMIQNPHLELKQINIEKELSIQSLKRQKENPFFIAFDGWRHIAFGKGPYGHDPLGSIKDLKSLSIDNLVQISKSMQSREKSIVISGSYPKNLENQLLNIVPFNQMDNFIFDSSNEKKLLKSSFNKKVNKYRISLNFEETSQVVLMLGQPTIGHGFKDDLCLSLLKCYLGFGMSSKLFIELREKNGVAYDVGVYYPIREELSPFILHASTSEEKAIKTLELLAENLKQIKEIPLSNNELSLAKIKYHSQLAHTTQTISQKAERKAHLLGLRLPPNHDENNLKKIKQISSNDIINVANKYLKYPILSLCGPKKILKQLERKWIINYL